MSSSSFTIPAKNSEDKIIRFALLAIWGILILFGIISLFQPAWLIDISAAGRISEARDYQKAGNAFIQKSNFKAAAAQYIKAIKIQPDLSDAYGNLGICYTQLKRYDEAIKIFNHLLKTDNENMHTNYYNLADIYKRKGNVNLAIESYIKAAQSNPFPIYSYQYLGELYLKIEQWKLAIEAFKLALNNKLTMENSYYGMLKGVKKSSLEEPDILESVNSYLDSSIDPNIYDIKTFDLALTKNREIAKTYNLLGYAYFKNNDLIKAKSNYETALSIWPKFSEAKRNLKKLNELNKENS